MENIKVLLLRAGFSSMEDLEKTAREVLAAMDPEDRKALKKEFRGKVSDESFQKLVEDYYEEIENEFKHKEDSER